MKEAENIYLRLSESFPPEAIQRTRKEETRKGYDTTGIGYQYCVNRFNEVLGLNAWGFDYRILKEIGGLFKNSGNSFFDITVEVLIWIEKPENIRKCVGGHVSSNYADALKGAITNAFKKTSAFWGVGKQAYEGTLDDDTAIEEERGTLTAPTINPVFCKPLGGSEAQAKDLAEKQKNLTEAQVKLWELLKANYHTKEKIVKGLIEFTAWTDKDGRFHEGKDSIYSVSDRMADVARHKLEKALDNQAIADGEPSPNEPF